MIALQQALGDRYVLERTLGRGGMGIVYLARETALDRMVALKLLPPSEATDELRERFLKEAKIAANLEHDNIVPIHAVGTAGPYVYYTMEYIRGETLFDRVVRDGPLPVAEVTRILHDVAKAVDYAHAQGVIHRDLKPNNILLEDVTGTAHVADFGIARIEGDPAPEGGGRTIGTYHFASPEQLAGLEADRRSDIYALGLVGYMMAAGQPPFDGTEDELIRQHLSTPAPLLRHVFGECYDTSLMRAVHRCLAKNPDARFQAAGELVRFLSLAPELCPVLREDLQTFVNEIQTHSGPSSLRAAAGLTALMVWGNALDRGRWATFGLSSAFLAGLLVAPWAGAWLATYRLLKKEKENEEYGRADIIHALQMELRRQQGPDAPKEKRWAKLLRAVSWRVFFSAAGAFVVGAVLALLRAPLPERLVTGSMIVGALAAAAAGVALVVLYRKLPLVQRRLAFFKSPLGEWMVKLARIPLGSVETDPALLDLAPAAAPRLGGSPAGPRTRAEQLSGIMKWSDSCMRRTRVFLEEALTTRRREGRTATPEEEERERTLQQESARLEALRAKFVVADGATAGAGSLTADLKAAWAACQALQGLIKAQEWQLRASNR